MIVYRPRGLSKSFGSVFEAITMSTPPTASIPADKDLCQRQIEATDRQIDALVYELYGLAGEEIAIVESGSRP